MLSDSLRDEFQSIVGHEWFLDTPEDLAVYSYDAFLPEFTPDGVLVPGNTEEISKIMKLANREMIPVTPRGAGSGLSGGATPIHGGIVLSLERMNRILEVDRDNMVVVVEPGVVTNAINEAVKDDGLFYAGYPMSVETCFIGGNVAENAGGGKAVKYGQTSTINPKETTDKVAAKICHDIAQAFEKRLTYPGEIKVTVLRETRCIEMAK